MADLQPVGFDQEGICTDKEYNRGHRHASKSEPSSLGKETAGPGEEEERVVEEQSPGHKLYPSESGDGSDQGTQDADDNESGVGEKKRRYGDSGAHLRPEEKHSTGESEQKDVVGEYDDRWVCQEHPWIQAKDRPYILGRGHQWR